MNRTAGFSVVMGEIEQEDQAMGRITLGSSGSVISLRKDNENRICSQSTFV
jgi:hypothetical protein